MLRLPTISRRVTLWVFALALLLKAAVPMLASAAAEVQGKTLVEVCTVYGVKTIALDGATDAPHDGDPQAGHGAEHCALGALVAGGALEAPALGLRVAAEADASRLTSVPPAPAAPDASATWLAQRKHGPPSFA